MYDDVIICGLKRVHYGNVQHCYQTYGSCKTSLWHNLIYHNQPLYFRTLRRFTIHTILISATPYFWYNIHYHPFMYIHCQRLIYIHNQQFNHLKLSYPFLPYSLAKYQTNSSACRASHSKILMSIYHNIVIKTTW